MGTIYQSIEILSKEKGIEPKIILDAVKDAMLAAARKHYPEPPGRTAALEEAAPPVEAAPLAESVSRVAPSAPIAKSSRKIRASRTPCICSAWS